MGQLARPTDWAGLEAPSIEDLERIAQKAYAALPQEFLNLCNSVLVRVADFPDDDVIEELRLESEFGVLGLFTGVGLAHKGGVFSGEMPNMIHLYRRPILDYWAEHEEPLGRVITHVLVHEIGHHFGLSDADMERIELAAG